LVALHRTGDEPVDVRVRDGVEEVVAEACALTASEHDEDVVASERDLVDAVTDLYVRELGRPVRAAPYAIAV